MSGKKRRHFVIQQHDATSMHFDFRLEVDGVLVSWAVPKGPSTDPGDKRLARRVEDHDMDHADFEGVIPEGEYGAGPVIVWDQGEYENLGDDDDGVLSMAEALEKGHVRVWLLGEKVSGGYSLLHAKLGGEEENWLLVKHDDEEADARRNPVSTETESVVSGRTVAQVAEEEDEDD